MEQFQLIGTSWAKIKFPALIQPKLDGMRALYFSPEGYFLSRGGRKLFYEADLPRGVYDGELTINHLSRAASNGEWNSVFTHNSIPGIFTFNIFDIIHRSDLLYYPARLQHLISLSLPNNFTIVQAETIFSAESLPLYRQKALELNMEGWIIKNFSLTWSAGRTTQAVKLKVSRETILTIDHINLGVGKYTGRLGSLTCSGNSFKNVQVGTGFTDAQREEFMTDSLLGTQILVEYQEVTVDSKLVSPRFIRLIHDNI